MACFALTRLHSSPTVTSPFTFLTSHCPIHCMTFLKGYIKTKLSLVEIKSPWIQLLGLHCVFACYLQWEIVEIVVLDHLGVGMTFQIALKANS